MSGPLFVAVAPDEPTRSLLAQMLAPFGAADRLPGKLSPPDNWHITVAFLGLLDPVAADRLIAGIDQWIWPGPPRVTLSGFGAFPRADRATVLWVGVQSETLTEVAATVDELADAAGIEPEERPFIPHLTLSRIRPPVDVSSLVEEDWGRLTFTARELVLFESVRGETGVRYLPRQRFPFVI
jgi:2'-5' RNA ligase